MEGNTPLHHAVIEKNLDAIIDIVSDDGSTIYVKNDYGKYPFHYTLTSSFHEAIPYVADKDLLNTMDDDGRYPVYYVCRSGDMLNTMINTGADLRLKDKYGKSGLWHIYNNMTIYDTDTMKAHPMILQLTDLDELEDIHPPIKRFVYIKKMIDVPVL